MKKIPLMLALTIITLATATAYTQHSDKPANYENENFEIKIVTNYSTQGSLQALQNVGEDEKRTMVLRQDFEGDLRQRCEALYGSSRHKHSNPCGMIQ